MSPFKQLWLGAGNEGLVVVGKNHEVSVIGSIVEFKLTLSIKVLAGLVLLRESNQITQ